MPRKRRRSLQRNRELDTHQYFDLVLGRNRVVRQGDRVWSSSLERKASWFEHRDQLLEEHRRDHSGVRPGAWWAYEHPALERLPAEEDFEYLLRAGELDANEKARVLAGWIKSLDLHHGVLLGAYEGQTHGWPSSYAAMCVKYDRQAALLGPPAEREWSEVRQGLGRGPAAEREAGPSDDWPGVEQQIAADEAEEEEPHASIAGIGPA